MSPAPRPLHPWIAERLGDRRFRYAIERTRATRAWPRHPGLWRGWRPIRRPQVRLAPRALR